MTAFIRRLFDGGGITTTLASGMLSADTSFVLTSATGWPGAAAAPFGVVIARGTASEEKILCTSNSGTTVTVTTRGVDGTSATTHNATDSVSLCGFAQDFDEANQLAFLLGNMATGSMLLGAGAATLPTKLATGTAAAVLGGGTSPAWVAGSNGQYLTVSGGSLAFGAVAIPTVLAPISKATSYAAVNGNLVNVTATATITSPAAAGGAVFGVIANYGATNASPVTLTTASGYFIGPGIAASTSSILLGTVGANVSFYSDGTNWYLTSGAQDSGWIGASLGNSWVTVTTAPAYRLVGNRVTLRGNMNGGLTTSIAFTLPSNSRPAVAVIASASGNSSGAIAAYLAIPTAGTVTPDFTGAGAIIFLDGVTFLTD